MIRQHDCKRTSLRRTDCDSSHNLFWIWLIIFRLAKELLELMKPMGEVALACDSLAVQRLDIKVKLQAVEIQLNELRQSIRHKKQDHEQ